MTRCSLKKNKCISIFCIDIKLSLFLRFHVFNSYVVFALLDHSIIIINEDVLDQGFCNLNGVNIDLRVTCKIQYFATLNFSVVANEYETNETIFLNCVRSIDATWICQGFGSMTGTYNKSFDLLEIALNLNYTVYAGHYLRTISSCDNIRDTKHIQLKACCKFI